MCFVSFLVIGNLVLTAEYLMRQKQNMLVAAKNLVLGSWFDASMHWLVFSF